MIRHFLYHKPRLVDVVSPKDKSSSNTHVSGVAKGCAVVAQSFLLSCTLRILADPNCSWFVFFLNPREFTVSVLFAPRFAAGSLARAPFALSSVHSLGCQLC